MLCEKCHIRSATVHLTNEQQGQHVVLNLCVPCATTALGQDLAGGEVAHLIGELIARVNPGAAAAPAAVSAEPAGQCPKCGLTGAEFQRLGKVGCAACYQTFAEPIAALLPTRGRGCEHRGSVPGVKPTADPGVQVERDTLLLELEQAVAAEAFERAAQIRDSLRRLE